MLVHIKPKMKLGPMIQIAYFWKCNAHLPPPYELRSESIA